MVGLACGGAPAREPDGGSVDLDAEPRFDARAPAAECLARATECSRTPFLGIDGQCMGESRRACVLAAPTCSELQSCWMGPGVDAGPADAGPIDGGPSIDGPCGIACHSCGYPYDDGGPSDICETLCVEGPPRDCIAAATTCEEMDACVAS